MSGAQGNHHDQRHDEDAQRAGCVFCHALRPKDTLVTGVDYNARLASTDRFVVLPALGPLVEGHVLVVSRTHAPSLASMGEEAIEEFDDLMRQVRARYPAPGGDLLEAEHGATDVQSGGGCIVHTHVNLIPHAGRYYNSLSSVLPGTFMSASRRRMLGIALLGLIIISVILTVVFFLPAYLIPSSSSPAQTAALKAQNDVRATLLQGIAGVVLLAGAYFTWRQVQVSKEAQLTERFTRTVEQLGNSKVDIRIGGIYGLERVAKDSPTDREPIAEILATYVQGHAPWPTQDSLGHAAPSGSPEVPLSRLPSLRTRAPDIHAAITVLGRRRGANAGTRRLKLYAVDLRKGNLQGANLRRADLRWSNLQGAYLQETNLEAARLEYADLQRATLRGANLQDTLLDGTKLKGVTANRKTVWPIGFDPAAAGVLVEDQLNE